MKCKTFKYRIYPTKSQTKKLEKTLNTCRWLYNHFLAERKNLWSSEKISTSYYGQIKTLPDLKKKHPYFSNVHSQILQNVAMRVDLAFKAFFRRIKRGEKPGYPRFHGKGRYNSFTYPQAGFKLFKKTVRLSKIGDVKIKLHRPIEGKIKTCTVKRMPTGKWFISFVCEINHQPVEQPIKPAIGIDMGLECFATLSNGEFIENPRFFRKAEKTLAKAQRKLSKQPKDSASYNKARKAVAHIHERIKWKRKDFAHQFSRKLVDKFNTICVEDLSINEMVKDNFRCINKSIGDAAWREFLNLLAYKAEWAGKRVVKVNPAYTSQTCSRCGHRHKLKLSDRMYHCPCCNLLLNRDHNAAINILRLGLQSLGFDP